MHDSFGNPEFVRRVARHLDRRRFLREARREASRAEGRVSHEGKTMMKSIQRIESGICVTIAALLAAGWVVAIGELFAGTA